MSGIRADVVVVGAGTAGSYFAWRMAEKGFSVVVVEEKKLGTLGEHIDIFHFDEIRFEQFGVPPPKGEEFVGYYEDGKMWPPDGENYKLVDYAFYVMRLPLFISRLNGYAMDAGAEIVEKTRYESPIIREGSLVGIRARQRGKSIEVRAPLTVDASGIRSVVRTSLPVGMGIETDPIEPQDTLHVILEYWDEIEEPRPWGLNFYPFHKTFFNPSYGDGAILGVGQPGSFEESSRVLEEFKRERFPHRHKLIKTCRGTTPYRRPPYSLVTSGFMVVGDAAFTTKPFSGEGVSSGFTGCKIASEVAAGALEKEYTSREALWEYNVRYFRDQGAKFAALMAQLPAAATLSRDDVNYLFEADVVFNGEDFTQINRDFETETSLAKTLRTLAKLMWGAAKGRFRRESLGKLIAVQRISSKLRKLYEKYPETPQRAEDWIQKVDSLWAESKKLGWAEKQSVQ